MSRLEAALERARKLTDGPPPLLPLVGDRREESDAELRKARALASLTAEVDAPRGSSATAMGFTGASADKLVVTKRPEQSTVEQYRKLAATLHHAQVERALKVVMVSSAVSGDGKTLTSTNLALTLSE